MKTFLRWLGPGIGVILLLVFLLLPPLGPLTPLGMKVVGIFLFTIIWWATVSISYPSLICIALLVLTGVMTPKVAFAASTGDWLILFLFGCFGLSEGLKVTGFSRRFAYWFMTRSFVTGRPWMLVAMLLLACTLLGSVMSLTATCIVFVAIAVPMLEALGYKKGDPFAAMLIMGIAWASTASASITPIAHAGNVMAMGWIRESVDYVISFPQWMLYGFPMGLLVYLVLLGIFKYVVRPDVNKITGLSTESIRQLGKIEPWKSEEKIAVGILILVLICWMMPGLAGGILPSVSGYFDKMGYAIPPLVGACLLCIIQVKGKPVLRFDQWMNGGMEWGTVVLVAAIQIIGVVIADPQTGIPALLTNVFEPIAASSPLYVFVLLAIAWVVLQTNVMSNLVSMTMVYKIMIPVAITTALSNPIALGVNIAVASNYAFALPSATTATAIVIGSGWVPVSFMFRYGIMLVIPMILIFTFIGYPYACLIFG